MVFALAFLAALACLLTVVAFGQVANTPTKLLEVDLTIVVFIQHLHDLLDVVSVDLFL